MPNDESLRKHWSDVVAKRASSLEAILKNATSTGATFKNPTQAALYAAGQLSALNPDEPPVSRTTLTRNEVYSQIIGRYVEGQKGKELKASDRLKYDLQLRDQRKQIESLQKQIAITLEERSKVECRIAQSLTHDRSDKAIHDDYNSWKKVINTLLAELEGAHFDIDKRTVEDPNGSGTLLREKDFPIGFFDWLKRTQR